MRSWNRLGTRISAPQYQLIGPNTMAEIPGHGRSVRLEFVAGVAHDQRLARLGAAGFDVESARDAGQDAATARHTALSGRLHPASRAALAAMGTLKGDRKRA